ncbi:hypothetical protein P3S68_006977 [Capsicum galapagoense]
MPDKRPVINRLSYVDDIVIFTSENSKSMKMITKLIHRYRDRRPQECLCCNNPQPETIKHVFIDSEPTCYL